jgi:hypothetical protein
VPEPLEQELGGELDTHGRFSLKANSAAFANVVSDVNPSLQLALEGNDRLTTPTSFGDKKAWLVISEVLFRL